MSKRKQQEIEKYIKKKRRAIQDGKTEVQSSSCIKLAELYTEIGSSKEAIEEYECAATILHDSNKLIEFGTVHRMIGEIYTTQLCDFEKALEHQSIHLNIARKENNLVEEQRALATIGRTHFCAAVIDPNNIKDGLLNKAYSAYAKSLNICENITGISKYELADMKARLLLNIGNIHEQQGNFEKAFKCLETAKKMSKSMDLFETLLIVLNAKSSLYARKKDYKVALQCLNEAYEVADRLSHERSSHLCEILQSKAEIFVKQDDYCSAKNTLMKAYKLKVSDESVQATVERLLKTGKKSKN